MKIQKAPWLEGNISTNKVHMNCQNSYFCYSTSRESKSPISKPEMDTYRYPQASGTKETTEKWVCCYPRAVEEWCAALLGRFDLEQGWNRPITALGSCALMLEGLPTKVPASKMQKQAPGCWKEGGALFCSSCSQKKTDLRCRLWEFLAWGMQWGSSRECGALALIPNVRKYGSKKAREWVHK